MTWLDGLGDELRARGVPPTERQRIVLELRDHIECEPGCEQRLGDPRALAGTFADELATSRARGSALWAFGALALAAVCLIVSQTALGAAGGYPGFTRGISLVLFVPAFFGLLVASQVALVAGCLALVRAARRQHELSLPAAEIELLERRTRIALLAGLATIAGLALYLIDFVRLLPGWYVALVAGLGLVAATAMSVAYRRLTRAQTIVSERPGEAGDVYDDLPILDWRWLRQRPWLLGVIGSLVVCLVTIGVGTNAERSLIEGVERGVAEGLFAAIGFVFLGRAVGLMPPRTPPRPDRQ
ncbi:MAG: hypothetical protein WAK93_15990 [Solirubrobacteraceae bacterium]